ncbi:O-antigen ligase family protein [Cellulomonas sp. S1-8]|uniref:O-antigen ligase family protein n=1 Tax=Cellulomonas sp. S1-8 TaxID=2904790 RepID=UPI002243D232|nr:O-antigen ligase family protein [Cellulomonas sp. S1-8]UZN04302.1 O-antigen ligase family protein [Cellulomonas sp. S1-8]
MSDRGTSHRRAARSTTAAPRLQPWLEPGLVVAVTVGFLLPLLVDSLTGVKEFRPITAAPVPDPPVVALAGTVGNLLVLAACLTVLVVHRRRWRDLLGPSALLLAAWAVALGVLIAHDAEVPRAVVLVPLVVAAGTLLRPGRAAVAAVGASTAAVAALSLVLGLLLPSAGRYVRPEAVADEKPVGALGILAGVLPSGNNLGVALALGLPAVLVLRRAWLRWTAVLTVLAALAWTASRASWLAAGAALVTALALHVAGRRRDVLAALALGAVGTANVVLPFVVSDPTAFTNRATYWIAGIDAWGDAPLLGHGADYYTRVAREGGELGGYAYQAHNQVVQLLVTGGVVMLALVGAAVVAAGVRAVRAAQTDAWPTTFLVALLCAALLEVPLGVVDRVMYAPVALLPLVLVLAWRPAPDATPPERRHAPPDTADAPAPARSAAAGSDQEVR